MRLYKNIFSLVKRSTSNRYLDSFFVFLVAVFFFVVVFVFFLTVVFFFAAGFFVFVAFFSFNSGFSLTIDFFTLGFSLVSSVITSGLSFIAFCFFSSFFFGSTDSSVSLVSSFLGGFLSSMSIVGRSLEKS